MSEYHVLLWQENGLWWGFSPETHMVYGERREWRELPSEERRALLEKKVQARVQEAGLSWGGLRPAQDARTYVKYLEQRRSTSETVDS